MKIIIENKQQEVECKSIRVYDDNDHEYMIESDKFGGLDIIANDGSLAIEPYVSNNITIKTI